LIDFALPLGRLAWASASRHAHVASFVAAILVVLAIMWLA
jgi:hypothetical protein